MGSGEVAIVALSTMISLKVTFSDGLGGEEFHKRCHSPSFHRKRLRWRMQTFAGKDANVCGEKRQCTARTDAVHCGDGCSALRERLQCTASEMGKTGTEIASPILDKRTGRRDAPVAPWKYLLNRDFYVIYI